VTKPGLDMLQTKAAEVAGLMKTLSHPNRLLIVCQLMDGERSVGQIEDASGVRQPTLSRELGRLRDEGLVTTRRESKVVFYSLKDAKLRNLMDVLCCAWGGGQVARDEPAASQSDETFYPTIEGRRTGRVRINPDPFRKD